MKKLLVTFLTVSFLLGTMATTALAEDYTTTLTQEGPLSLSNVVEKGSTDGEFPVYYCDKNLVVTITQDIYWLNLYYLDPVTNAPTPIYFDITYGSDNLPAFDISNLTVEMTDTGTVYTMEEYYAAVASGKVDYNDDPTCIPAGSSFTVLCTDTTYFFESILLDSYAYELCIADVVDYETVLADYEAYFAELEAMLAGLAETAFSDVAEGAPYEDAVLWAVEHGVTTGYDDGTFRPDATCTRGQVVTFLYRAMGEPEVTTTENHFSDVSEDSAFYDAILWAVENGITTGYKDGTFRPGETCTSAQVITFLHRAEDTPVADVESPLAASAGAAFVPAINWADAIGLLDGMDFVANDPSPRSDIVTYLYLVANTVEMA